MVWPAYAGKRVDADRVRQKAAGINITWYGAKGSDSVLDSTVNTTALATAQAEAAATGNRGIYLPLGSYYFDTGILIDQPKTWLYGDVGTEVKFIDAYTGPLLSLDGGVGPIVGAPMYGCLIENITLIGHAGVARAVFARNFHQSSLINIQVEDVTDEAFYFETCTGNYGLNLACSTNRRFFAIQPERGFVLTRRADDVGLNSSINTFENLTIEGLQASVLGLGIDIEFGVSNTFIGGTSEGNKRGVRFGAAVGSTAEFNAFYNITLVQNTTEDIQFAAAATGNLIDGAYSQAPVNFAVGSRANRLQGGFYGSNITNASAFAQAYERIMIANAAALVDPVTVAPDRRYWDIALAQWSSI